MRNQEAIAGTVEFKDSALVQAATSPARKSAAACVEAPRPPPGSVNHQEDSGLSVIVMLTAVIYSSARTQSTLSKRGQAGGTPQETLIPPAAICGDACKVVIHQGSLLETLRPGCFLGAGHVGTFCPAPAKIPDTPRESRWSA